VFVCSQLQHTAHFLLLVTAASDLLVHKILLQCKFCSAVSYCLRRCPTKTPRTNTPCFLPFVGRLGPGPRLVGRIVSGVRVSVSFRQKYPPGSVLRCPTAAENVVMTKGVVSGGGFDLRLQRITSNPSQTIRPRLVRRTATDAAVSARLDACRRSRLYFSHFAMYGLQYCRPVCSVCSAFFCHTTCIRRPYYGGSGQNIAILFGTEKLEWLGYSIW